MDFQAAPLTLTKIRVPAPQMRLVARPQLIERLEAGPACGLTLVCAPAGYGKTSLLAEWAQVLQREGRAVAWYTIDAGDDAALPFGSYLAASLAQALGASPELARLAQLLRARPETDLNRVVPAILNAAAGSGRECVLVLDDYHLIASPEIHAALAYLLEHRPNNLRFAIGSRAEPPLPLARLRARGQLRELRAGDLRFTTGEADRFLNDVMRLELPPELVAALETRTEGWAAGLQLAALSLAGRAGQEGSIAAFRGDHRFLADYLLEEVFAALPDEIQAFLLSTAPLERLCGPLCDAVAAADGAGAQILESLEQQNLFVVALDQRREWYRYHHLFRDFLQARLHKTQPGRAAGLHRAASEWQTANGFLREAVHHALQTGDWEFAAGVVEQHGITLVLHGEFATVYEWSKKFPEAVIQARPTLALFQANALALTFRRAHRVQAEKRLEQVEQAAAGLADPHLANVYFGQAATTRAALAAMTADPAADPGAQFALARKALDLLAPDDPARSAVTITVGYAHMARHDAPAARRAMEEARRLSLASQNYFGVVEAHFHLARLAHELGELDRAAEICRQGQAEIASLLAEPERDLPAVGCLDVALGRVLLEKNELEQAERHLLHGLGLIWEMVPYYQMTACMGLYRLRAVQGRPAEALEFLARLEAAWPDIAFATRGVRAAQTLQAEADDPQALAEAGNWLRSFAAAFDPETPPPGLGPFGAAEAVYLARLAWARAQLAAGSPQAARALLTRQLGPAQEHGLTSRVVELRLLKALAWQAEGAEEHALAALAGALEAAEPAGYLRSFDQGPALDRLLVKAAGRGICPVYVERILSIAGSAGGEPKVEPPRPGAAAQPWQAVLLPSGERLSRREGEVLQCMAAGCSNQEIAERLVITVGTVKSHVNRILRKLAAANRTEAVARARRQGLLQD